MSRSRVLIVWLFLGVAIGSLAVLAYVYGPRRLSQGSDTGPDAADPAVVRDFCTKCHAYPSPDSFPRSAWKKELEQAYRFAYEAGLVRSAPPMANVLRYFEEHSPDELPGLPFLTDSPRCPVQFDATTHRLPGKEQRSIVTSAKLVALTGTVRSELLVCDSRTHEILLKNLADPKPDWKVIGRGSFPARAEVVDLDGDGVNDVIVSNMGIHFPSDDRLGSVVWLRGHRDGTFEPVTLLDGVGRVVDVKAVDVDGNGKLDLIVAVFGWRQTGELILLRNRTTDWAHPVFEPEVLDRRHGAIQIEVADLNGDGKPDFVALFGQEHEQVVMFLNDGHGGFKSETVYAAPHPAYGSSGIQLVDIDGDGDLDILYVNGDTLDPPPLLKPYHGVQWLENTGGGKAFVPHRIGHLYGAMAAIAADFDGDGKMDVAAVTYLPADTFPDRADRQLPAVVLYQQTSPGEFTPHVLARGSCDHLTCAAGVLPGDRLPSLIVGEGCFLNQTRKLPAVTVWRNRGTR